MDIEGRDPGRFEPCESGAGRFGFLLDSQPYTQHNICYQTHGFAAGNAACAWIAGRGFGSDLRRTSPRYGRVGGGPDTQLGALPQKRAVVGRVERRRAGERAPTAATAGPEADYAVQL